MNDEIRILKEGWRLLGNDVQTGLLARGWVVADLGVADDAPLEFFWPPTAPIGFGGLPEWTAPEFLNRPQMYGHRETPWTAPTRIVRERAGWRVEYGEAIAQEPDPSTLHETDQGLLDDLPRIEWWPMSVDEARKIQIQRVFDTTRADAFDQFSLGFFIRTEPYEKQRIEILERLRPDAENRATDDDAWRWAGDLKARLRINDAEAWASAVRTARAGGEGWNTSGRERPSEQG